jgi:hypothetical protein
MHEMVRKKTMKVGRNKELCREEIIKIETRKQIGINSGW